MRAIPSLADAGAENFSFFSNLEVTEMQWPDVAPPESATAGAFADPYTAISQDLRRLPEVQLTGAFRPLSDVDGGLFRWEAEAPDPDGLFSDNLGDASLPLLQEGPLSGDSIDRSFRHFVPFEPNRPTRPRFVRLLWEDHRNFYSLDNLTLLAVGTAVACPLANTDADQEVHDWYQEQWRSQTTDRISSVVKELGDHWQMSALYLAAAIGGRPFVESPVGGWVQGWGKRNIRVLLVGAPPLWLMQSALGGSRPDEAGSGWGFFADVNSVSGHAFVGAAPLLVASSMTDNRLARHALAAASFLPAWSRINDDEHYLSQAALGWWLAYLTTRSVHQTDLGPRRFRVAAAQVNGAPGVAVELRR